MEKACVLFAVAAFLSAVALWAMPSSYPGRLSLKLCLANAFGWTLLLPLDERGHPPPVLIGLMFFWLINAVLLPAAAASLWKGFKDREERRAYLVIASTYVTLNIIVLFAIPITWLLWGAFVG